ncbi:MAG: PorP/SprF family type IX secretion system membrane protein [Cyclobacteriaceae bacterium]
MKSTHKIILNLCLSLSFTWAIAQQQPQFSQFTDTQLFFNPANVGFQDNLKATLIGRWQWIGFDGAPVTYAGAVEMGIPDKQIGLGLSVMSDQTAQFETTTVQVYSAYKLQITSTSQLSMGISGAINSMSQDLTNTFVLEDEALFSTNVQETNANFGLGFHYQARKWWLGVSAPFLLNNSFEEGNIRFYDQRRHYYAQGGMTLDVNDRFSLKPAVLMQLVSGGLPTWNTMVMAWYDNKLGGGLGYRKGESLNFIAQAELGNGIKAGYAYDMIVDSDLNQLANSSHEVLLTFSSGWFVSKDADDDGVKDKDDECPNTFGPASNNGCPLPDQDGDGVLDMNDQCPTIAGLASLQGCPDSDGDGIKDADDNCPNEKGSKANQGCPDSDGDGVLDKNDSCPQTPGNKELGGCPDDDGDGIVNSKDNCPNEAGTIENKGCPEISQETQEILKEALSGVQFESGKDVLTKKSNDILNKVANLLLENNNYDLKISGYTDSSGDEEKNLQLSKQRANAVKGFLVEKGINADRISADGYGQAKPLADNATKEGRAKNRRVEFELKDRRTFSK